MLLVGGENIMDLIALEGEGADLHFRAVEGGSPYNTALAAARLGAQVGYLTPISDDHLGRRLSARLQREGVRLLSESVSAPTSLALVTLREGQASYQFYREMTAERCLDSSQLRQAITLGTALHIGSLALTGDVDGMIWVSLFEEARKRGLFTSVDLNIRPQFVQDEARYRERLSRVMTSAQLIKMSDEDLSWWVGRELLSPTELRQACLAIGRTFRPQLLLLTRGSRGATVIFESGSRVSVIERPAARLDHLQDTVGAGDTFMGAFLSALTPLFLDEIFFNGWTLEWVEQSLKRALNAAAYCCEQQGCRPPTLEELNVRLADE